MRVISIDPGEAHCGWSSWHIAGLEPLLEGIDVYSPERLIDWLCKEPAYLRTFDLVVCEEWRVYDGGQATWSTCATAEVIGMLRHHCRWDRVPLVMQKAAIKRPAFGWMRHHGKAMPDLAHIPSGDRQHAKDAVAHFWRWLSHWREGMNPGA